MDLAFVFKVPSVLLSVDFEKAFDRVDYAALIDIMTRFNFGNEYITWVKVLFNQFTLRVTNYGYLSDVIKPTRGLFQGNPISSYLFLLIAETLALKIKANKKIERLEFGKIKYLLSQFTDDLNIFLQFKKSAWKALMECFDQFEQFTGMKISYEKTMVYRIGSLRNTNAKFYSTRRTKWTNDPQNVLGVVVSHDYQEYMTLNYEPILEKARAILELLRARSLSLVGKVQVLNSLVSSLFSYKMTVLPKIPDRLTQEINSIIRDFLWDGGKAKIALSKISMLKDYGGLGLANMLNRDRASKAHWPLKVSTKSSLKKLVYRLIDNPLDDLLWQCQLDKKDIK